MEISQELIDRINVLANKAKNEGLTEEEVAEQKKLRQAYLKAFRKNLISQLESVEILEPDGTITPVKRRHSPKKVENSSEI